MVIVEDPPATTPHGDAITAIVPVEATAGDWTMFHGTPSREGVSGAPHIARPRLRWLQQIGVQGWLNSPLIAGQQVVVPSSGNTHNASDPRDGVFALELATGRIAWHAHFSGDANGAAVAGDKVIATSDDGHIYGLDVQTGRIVWKQSGQGKVYTTPLILGDLGVVGDAQGYLRAFRWADGTKRWEARMNGAIRGGAASDGQAIYAVSQGGEVAAFGLDGTAIWRVGAQRPAYSGGTLEAIEGYAAPIVTGGLVVVPFARDTYYPTPAFLALDARTGKVRWRASSDNASLTWGNVRSTPVLVHNLLVFAEAYSSDVAGIDVTTGAARYRAAVGRCMIPQYGAPAAAGTVLI